MSIEPQKINLINWLSTIQEDSIREKVERFKRKKPTGGIPSAIRTKKAIDEGLEQLDKGEYITHSQVRSKIKERFNFQ